MVKKRLNKKSLGLVYTSAAVSALVLALLIAASYFAAMRSGFDYEIMHFDLSPWYIVLIGGVAVAAACALALVPLSRGYVLLPDECVGVGEYFPRVLGAAVSVLSLVSFVKEYNTDRYFMSGTTVAAGFSVIFIGAALLLGGFKKTRSSRLTAFVHLLAVLSANLWVFAEYFDLNNPINGPVRNVTTALVCSSLLFLLAEAKFCLASERSPVSAALEAFASFFISSVAGGLSLGALLLRAVENNPADTNLPPLSLGLVLSLAILAEIRLFSLKRSLLDSELMDALSDDGNEPAPDEDIFAE